MTEISDVAITQNLQKMEKEALAIMEEAISLYSPKHIVAMCSSGNDSLAITHIASRAAQTANVPFFVFHIDTGIKVIDPGYDPEDHVRYVCDQNGWDLRVYRAVENALEDGTPDPQIYEKMVLEGCNGKGFPFAGFPGPAMHGLMFRRLKERQVSRMMRDIGATSKNKAMLVTGVRKSESTRRWENISGRFYVKGSQIWTNPIIDFTAEVRDEYLKRYGIPLSPVRKSGYNCTSGECLCGAFAKPNELTILEMHFPETGKYLRELEAKVKGQGYPWGWDEEPPAWWGEYTSGNLLYPEISEEPSMPLCTSCINRHEEHKELVAEMNQSITQTLDKPQSIDRRFCLPIPAGRGRQGGRIYYSANIPLGVLARLAVFDESELPPSEKAQRPLTESRIPEISTYMVENREGYAFPSITLCVTGDVEFDAYEVDLVNSQGKVWIPIELLIRIIDGQHRFFGIKKAIEVDSSLAEDTVTVQIYCNLSLAEMRQMFADLNWFGKKVNTSTSIAYDYRDDRAIITHKVHQGVPAFKALTEFQSNISKKSSKLFMLNQIFDANNKLFTGTKLSTSEKEKVAIEFWRLVSESIPEWQMVLKKQVAASEVRANSLCSHGVILVAIAQAGNELIKTGRSFDEYLPRLKEFDFSRENEQWIGTVIHGGAVKKSAKEVAAAASLIKRFIGLE